MCLTSRPHALSTCRAGKVMWTAPLSLGTGRLRDDAEAARQTGTRHRQLLPADKHFTTLRSCFETIITAVGYQLFALTLLLDRIIHTANAPTSTSRRCTVTGVWFSWALMLYRPTIRERRGQRHSQFAVVATPIRAVCHLLLDNQLPLLTTTVTFPHIYERHHVLHIYSSCTYIKVTLFC